MEDRIQELPIDQVPPTQEERELCDWLFSDTTTTADTTEEKRTDHNHRLYRILLVTLIFFVFQLPLWSPILYPYFPNPFIQVLVKTFIFLIILILMIRY